MQCYWDQGSLNLPATSSNSSRDQILPGLHVSALQAMRDVADMPMAARAIVDEGGAGVS